MARWEVEVLFLLAVTLGKCLAQTSELELTPAERIAPGEDVYINLFPNMYGNNVIRRDLNLPAGGDKIWLDRENTLPSGNLLRFFVYVHNFSNPSSDIEYLRLQIWRAIDLEEEQHMLVDQIRVAISTNQSSTGTLYSFRPKDMFVIKHLDRIGWTSEGTVCPISFEYTEGRRTVFSSFELLPEVSETFTFNEIFLPSVFSVAVEVIPPSLDPCQNSPKCNQLCQMANDSVQCSCIDGFHLAEGEHYNCTDIDECGTTSLCHQRCVNIPGHYYCACEPGFYLADDFHTCKVADPCLHRPRCNQLCQSTNGSMQCSCFKGFHLADGELYICTEDESGISAGWIAFIVAVCFALVLLPVNITMIVRQRCYTCYSCGSNHVTSTTVRSKPDDEYDEIGTSTVHSGSVHGNETPQENVMNIAIATDDGYEIPVKEEDGGYSQLNPKQMDKSSHVYAIPNPGFANE